MATRRTQTAVKRHLTALRRESSLDTGGEALAAVALSLAALLDAGEPVMMTASWARELRVTLAALGGAPVPVDDGWLDALPSAIRRPEE